MYKKKMMWKLRIEYLDKDETMTIPYEEFYYKTRAEAEKAAAEFEQEKDIVEIIIADEPKEREIWCHEEEEFEL